MPKVLVAGDANVDLIVPFPRFLNDRRTLVEYPNPCLAGGGTCANTAVALSRLGVRTGFAGTIGCDQYGAYIKKDFEKEGVDTACLIEDARKNTVCVFELMNRGSATCGDGPGWTRHLRKWIWSGWAAPG